MRPSLLGVRSLYFFDDPFTFLTRVVVVSRCHSVDLSQKIGHDSIITERKFDSRGATGRKPFSAA